MSYGRVVHETLAERELQAAKDRARNLREETRAANCPGSAPWPDADRVRTIAGPTFDLWLSSIHVHPDGSLGCDPRKARWVNDRFRRVLGVEVVACGGDRDG